MMLLNKAESLINAIIENIDGITKPRQKFIIHLLILFMGLRGKYNFTNMARYGTYCEQSYRNQLSEPFQWVEFNKSLIDAYCCEERFAAFDPSFIRKSGKKTPHLGRYWSGKDQAVKTGLEIGALAVVDARNNTAFPLQAIQTPKISSKDTGDNLVDHYSDIILKQLPTLISLKIAHLAVDAFFAKKRFIDAILSNSSMHVISRLRNDANLRYRFEGKQKRGPGRKKKYGDKVNVKYIDERRIRLCFEEADGSDVFSGIVYSVSMQRFIRIVYIQHYDSEGIGTSHSIFFSTDLNLAPGKILQYYRQRYQIEFLFRDSKNFAGLEDCQARSENKLYNHVNASMSTIGLAKALHYLNIPEQERESFSMADVKVMYFNQFITDFIFSKLSLDITCEKYKSLYEECLSIGRLAA